MHRFRSKFAVIAMAAIASLAIVSVVAAQAVPSLFIGSVKSADGTLLPGAQVVGKIGGEVCGQTTANAFGDYGLVVPDLTSRPLTCGANGAQVELSVNGTIVTTATKGPAGAPITVNLQLPAATATPTPSPTPSPTPTPPSQQTIVFNDAPTSGVNSAAVIGPATSASQLETRVESQSGKEITAIWMFSSGQWNLYLPGAIIDQIGNLTPPVSLFFVFA